MRRSARTDPRSASTWPARCLAASSRRSSFARSTWTLSSSIRVFHASIPRITSLTRVVSSGVTSASVVALFELSVVLDMLNLLVCVVSWRLGSLHGVLILGHNDECFHWTPGKYRQAREKGPDHLGLWSFLRDQSMWPPLHAGDATIGSATTPIADFRKRTRDLTRRGPSSLPERSHQP